MMVARCLQQFTLVKRLSVLKAIGIFRDHLACVSKGVGSMSELYYDASNYIFDITLLEYIFEYR